MKKILYVLLIMSVCSNSFAQRYIKLIDSLNYELTIARHDTSRIQILIGLCSAYISFQKDSSQFYGEKALKMARKIKDTRSEAKALIELSDCSRIYGDAPQSLEYAFKAIEIAEKNNHTLEIGSGLNSIGLVYGQIFNDYNKAINYIRRAKQINDKSEEVYEREKLDRVFDLNLGQFYCEVNQLDSSLMYLKKLVENTKESDNLIRIILRNWADLQYKLGNMDAAMEASAKSVSFINPRAIGRGTAEIYFNRALLFNKLNTPDSSIHFAKLALTIAEDLNYTRIILLASQLLSDEFETKDKAQSIYYHKLARTANDSLYGRKKMQEIQRILAEEQERKKIIEAEEISRQNRMKQYLFLSGLGILLLIAFILYRNNQKAKKAKNLLQVQKDKVESTLSILKSTQAQLIQSEKMASLGELTAGIAHEIQNPLNFVNNFSELSVDLAKELKEEIETLNIPEKNKEYVTEIIGDLSQNQEKINHHGKRASDIVKGMLEHSRNSTGQIELTDINALCDEYFRLAYQSMKAKDNDLPNGQASFNATMETHFDPNLPNIKIIPQDIGRVLLNLINNAFYAVNERSKKDKSDYVPTVSVTTQLTANSQLLLTIKDNGSGIPDTIKDKIFQPFFTTKPTGQGTGLGLSLSYDIVKAHGGELKVETKEGEGSEFVIQIPIN